MKKIFMKTPGYVNEEGKFVASINVPQLENYVKLIKEAVGADYKIIFIPTDAAVLEDSYGNLVQL